MKKYPCYVNARLPWVQPIPKHWKLLRNKVFLSEREEKSTTGDETLLSLSQYTGVSVRGKNTGKTGMYKAESLIGYKAVFINDIVMNIMLAWNGSTAKSKHEGIISPAYAIYKIVNDIANPDYLHYIFKIPQYMRYFEIFSTGIIKSRLRLYPQSFLHLYTIIPPRPEQEQIVRFLDWKVASINKLIRMKQRQISTLKELMQAEIEKQLYAYPVTNTIRLKQLGTFFKGGGFSRDNLVENGRYPAILYGDIYTQYEYKTSVVTHYIDGDAYAASQKILKGDIVMAGTGETKDEIGKSVLYMGDEIVAVGGDVIVFRPHDDINVEYLLYQLYSQAALKHRYINGKGDIIAHIYSTALGNTMITLPGATDQKKAVARINRIIDQIRKIIATLSEEISILREYQVCLIANTVTGKIDVRDIKIPEYECVTESAKNGVEDAAGEEGTKE